MFVRFLKIAVVFFLICLMCACGEKEIELFSGDIDATVSYTRFECEYTVKYSRSGAGEVLEVLAPERIRGLKALRKDGKVTINYTDLEYESVTEKMFEPFELLLPVTVKKQDENVYVSENGDVTVIFEGESPKEVIGNGFTLEILEFSERSEAE